MPWCGGDYPSCHADFRLELLDYAGSLTWTAIIVNQFGTGDGFIKREEEEAVEIYAKKYIILLESSWELNDL